MHRSPEILLGKGICALSQIINVYNRIMLVLFNKFRVFLPEIGPVVIIEPAERAPRSFPESCRSFPESIGVGRGVGLGVTFDYGLTVSPGVKVGLGK
jgi:hypothetical protein